MSDTEKVLTYEEAKELCREAFDGGVTYGSESMRYGVNARAYDWDHWLKKHERLFMSAPTVEGVLREMVADLDWTTDGEDKEAVIKEYAAKLRLAGEK